MTHVGLSKLLEDVVTESWNIRAVKDIDKMFDQVNFAELNFLYTLRLFLRCLVN